MMARTPNDRYLDAGWAAPAVSIFSITPADSDLADDTRAIHVGGAGTLVITCPDGSSATFTCVAGQLLPVVARRVAAASTATLLVGMR